MGSARISGIFPRFFRSFSEFSVRLRHLTGHNRKAVRKPPKALPAAYLFLHGRVSLSYRRQHFLYDTKRRRSMILAAPFVLCCPEPDGPVRSEAMHIVIILCYTLVYSMFRYLIFCYRCACRAAFIAAARRQFLFREKNSHIV